MRVSDSDLATAVPAAPAQRAAPRVAVTDDGRPMWLLLAVFLVPLVLSNALQSAGQTIGSIYLGRLIGVRALAAVSVIFPIVFLLISFMIGLASGSSVLIGQAYGARDEHRMKAVAGTTLAASLWLGAIVGAAGLLLAPELLRWIGTPPDIFADAVLYARILFASLPVFFAFIAYTTFLRGTGDAATPFYALVLTTAISLVVSPALILGWFGLPRLGVASVAVASIVANTAGLAGLIAYLARVRHPLRLDLEVARDLRVEWPILAAVVRIGIPSAIQMIFVALAEIAVITFVNRFGSDATAAYGAVNQVVGYVQFPAISIGIAASIFGAQAIGAERNDLLRKVVRAAVGLNYALGVLLVGACYLFAREILGWFITAPHALAIAHRLLMITLWSYLLFGNAAVLSGIMRGSGTVVWPTLIGIAAIWGVEVPVAYVMMRQIGLDGVWLGYPAAFCANLCLQFAYYELVWRRREHRRIAI